MSIPKLGSTKERDGEGNGIIDSVDVNLSKLWEIKDREAWHVAVYEAAKSRIQLSD